MLRHRRRSGDRKCDARQCDRVLTSAREHRGTTGVDVDARLDDAARVGDAGDLQMARREVGVECRGRDAVCAPAAVDVVKVGYVRVTLRRPGGREAIALPADRVAHVVQSKSALNDSRVAAALRDRQHGNASERGECTTRRPSQTPDAFRGR